MSPVSSTFSGASSRSYGMFAAGTNTWVGYLADGNAAASQDTIPYATMFDSSGGTYSCGSFKNGSGGYNAFVAKFGRTGSLIWQRSLSDALAAASQSDIIRDVAVDSSGNVYIAGQYATATRSNAFVAKYDSTGALTWQRFLYGASSAFTNIAYGVAVDSSGNVYACGSFGNASGGTNAFLVKYDSSGTLSWQRSIVDGLAAGSQGDVAYAVSLDSSGNPHIAGSFYTAGPTFNGFVIKYDTTGALQWQRSIGSTSNAVAVDSSGRVNIGGWWYNGSTGVNAFTAQYNSSGTLQWQRTLANPDLVASNQNDVVNSISVDASGNVYSAGLFYTTVNTNGFVAKYDSSGTLQFQRKLDDAADTVNAFDIAVDADNFMRVSAGFTNTSSGLNAFVSKMNSNGLPTSTFNMDATHSVVYAAGALTSATGSLTSATSTLTSATSSLTNGTAALTDAAGSLTFASIII